MSRKPRPSAPPTRPEHGPRTAYLVLGMHRSGTSAVTQLLALAGAQLPDNVMPGDEHNAKGYFEPWKIALFNDERLRAAGSAWDDPFAYPYRQLAPDEDDAWRARAREIFETEYAGAAVPLLKDPRISVLLPFWRPVLEAAGVTSRCVIAVRHPLAVAGSLTRRDGFPVEKSLLVWASYMLGAEAQTRDLPRAFVSYDALLADWRAEVVRIERAHDAPLPGVSAEQAAQIDSFLSPELRHNAVASGLAAYGWAGEIAGAVYDWCAAAARDEQPDPARLQEAADALERRRREIGALVSPVTRDLDAARSELAQLRAAIEHYEPLAREYYLAKDQLDELLAWL